MTANKLEGKARELLAAEYDQSQPSTADAIRAGRSNASVSAALRAIVRALDTARQSEGMVPERLLDALDAACGEFARRTGGCQRVCWYGYTHADRIATVAAAIAAAAPADAGEGK